MAPKLSDEQREAIVSGHGAPIEVEDEQSRRVYILVARDDFSRLVDAELRRELQIGFDQADRGDVADWNVEEILAEAHRRHSQQAEP